MKNRILMPLLFLFACITAGCNTIHGAGQDLERGGEKIQSESNRHR